MDTTAGAFIDETWNLLLRSHVRQVGGVKKHSSRHSLPQRPVQMRFAWLAGICILMSAAGCRRAATHYTLTGQVLIKDDAGRMVTVHNDDIPGFMPPMTMDYTVKDPQGVGQVKAGDMIRADIVVKNNTYWLEHLTVTDRSKEGEVAAAQLQPLALGQSVPDVPMVNQDGKTVHLADFKGRAVLLTFIYTRCPFPTYCPLITSEFAEIHKELAQTPAIYQKTQLVSISLDPEYDKPPVLRKYGLTYLKGNASGFSHWEFVSTSPADLKKLASAFGLAYLKQNNVIEHSMNTILLARDGAVLQMWPGNDWKPAELIAAVKSAATSAPSKGEAVATKG